MSSRAIILAAGRGSRMGKETALKPKCLTKLAGRHLIDWQLDALRSAGISDITVVRGYRAEMIYGDFNVVDNKRWNETNMVASLFCAPASNDSTIISYSDIVYHPEHVRRLEESTGDIAITADVLWEELWKLRFENPLDDAETFKSKNDQLIEIGQKTNDIKDIQAQYMGLIKLSKNGWNSMYELYSSFSGEKKDKLDMTSMLNALLDKGIAINVVFVNGRWCEADNYSDILAYEKAIQETNEWNHDWR